MEEKHRKWREALKVHSSDAFLLLNYRSVYQQLVEVLKRNASLRQHKLFLDFAFNSYATWAAMMLRRLSEINRNGYTLKQLLTDIAENPKLISREYYRELYAGTVVHNRSDIDFEKFVVFHGDSIDPDDVRIDIARLDQMHNQFKTFVDKVLAHRDGNPPSTNPMWQDLEDAVDLIERILIKYNRALEAVDREALFVRTNIDWHGIADSLAE